MGVTLVVFLFKTGLWGVVSQAFEPRQGGLLVVLIAVLFVTIFVGLMVSVLELPNASNYGAFAGLLLYSTLITIAEAAIKMSASPISSPRLYRSA